jgi:hypothetical protein
MQSHNLLPEDIRCAPETHVSLRRDVFQDIQFFLHPTDFVSDRGLGHAGWRISIIALAPLVSSSVNS